MNIEAKSDSYQELCSNDNLISTQLSNIVACSNLVCCIHSYIDQSYSFWAKDF